MLIAKHLTADERIKLGAFYTPELIVKKVKELVLAFLSDNVIVLDPAGGCGAFIKCFQEYNYRVADIDPFAIEHLKKSYDPEKVFFQSALENVNRYKYNISDNDFLIIVGNPPYNDWTSLYKKGTKGNFTMDEDVFDRDLGIAFLKAMNKLKANVICVLHPMSYLIKKANFLRLKEFFKNYKLLKAYVFPSFVFHFTSKSVGFPVLIALYVRNSEEFTYNELLDFEFEFLFSKVKFKLKEIQTTDGMINKYPRTGTSSLGLYFHTFRDINSLLRNRDFLLHPSNLTIPIEWDNLPHYAYLVALKHYIKEKGVRNFWFYGNFSPLIDKEFYENHKIYFLHYALEKTKALPSELKVEIKKRYLLVNGFSEIVNKYFSKIFSYAEKSYC